MKKKTVRDNEKILSGICFALIIGFWCIATYGGLISDLFLPSPTEVVKKIIEMAKDGSLWANCWESTVFGKDDNEKLNDEGNADSIYAISQKMADFWMEKGECETDDLTDFFELVK